MKIILSETQFKNLCSVLKEEKYAYDSIDLKAREANTNPTDKQIQAGNYKMGHLNIMGLKITIENPEGSYRQYKDKDGKIKKTLIKNHYGYFSKTKGKDSDNVDVFIGPIRDNIKFVQVIDQKKTNGEFDESKVMLGFRNKKEAKNAYLRNYDKDWKGFMKITSVPFDVFKEWLYRGRKQRIPFSEYVLIKNKKGGN